MTEMIERVAKAVKRCYVFPLGDLREYLSNEDAITIARAAIAAMREPTEDMGGAAVTDYDNYAHRMSSYYCVTEAWRNMIDAALECSTKPDEK